MPLYELPKFQLPKLKPPKFTSSKLIWNQIVWILVLTIFVSSIFGFLAGTFSGSYFYLEAKNYLSKFNLGITQTENSSKEYLPQTSQEQAIINVVKENSPAVVSIIITKDVPILEQYYISPFEEFFGQEFLIPQYRQKGTEKQEIGGGTGFIVSKDGLILTNKHVILDESADYTVLTNDGKRFAAKVLAQDPVQDLAIIKIEQEKTVDSEGKLNVNSFPVVTLGDSDKLQIGQTVIAIGNALGEFRNTVSVGVVSGLGRTITASGGGMEETLEDTIQTDAAINKGNSGGPLLNLKGEVIGINTAMSEAGQNIGFALPINKAKKDVEQVKTSGKISFPFLGVRYVLINDSVKEKNKLPVNYGAWLQKGSDGEPAVSKGSAAEKSGLKEEDIILEFSGEKITTENTLAKILQKYNPNDKVVLKVLRDGKEIDVEVVLGERDD